MKAVTASPEEPADHSKTVGPARERPSSLSVPRRSADRGESTK
jgi:hypothetical protein